MKSNVKLIVRITLLFWCAAKIFSLHLWLAERNLPLVPVLAFPPVFHSVLFASFFVFAVFLLFMPLNNFLLIAIIFVEVLSMLGDELRWQPWEYQYLFIVFIALSNQKNERRFFSCLILVLASTYFFSGIEKINRSFLTNVWIKLVLIQFLRLPSAIYINRMVRYMGLLIPACEILFGCVLLLKKRLRFFAWLPIAMHVFIMILLSPFGIHYNSIVIPWNLSLAIFVYFIFIKNKASFFFPDIIHRPNLIVAVGWIILPAFGVFGYWDKFLSSGVYSGKGIYLQAYVNDSVQQHPELMPYVSYSKKGLQGQHQVLNFFNWSLKELRIPIPPEERINKSIEKTFLEKYPDLHPIFHYY